MNSRPPYACAPPPFWLLFPVGKLTGSWPHLCSALSLCFPAPSPPYPWLAKPLVFSLDSAIISRRECMSLLPPGMYPLPGRTASNNHPASSPLIPPGQVVFHGTWNPSCIVDSSCTHVVIVCLSSPLPSSSWPDHHFLDTIWDRSNNFQFCKSLRWFPSRRWNL